MLYKTGKTFKKESKKTCGIKVADGRIKDAKKLPRIIGCGQFKNTIELQYELICPEKGKLRYSFSLCHRCFRLLKPLLSPIKNGKA